MNKRATKSHRSTALLVSLTAFAALVFTSFLLYAIASLMEGVGLDALTNPIGWLRDLDHAVALDALSNAAEVVAAVLAIAITVVAIVLELAANRYSHQITQLFVSDPVNIVVMSLFVVTTVQCVWIATTLDPAVADAFLPNAGVAITMGLVTVSLLVLLPYFAFVLSFLSPVNVIEKIRESALKAMVKARPNSVEAAKLKVQQAVDELQDVARSATEQSDRGIAMASVNALSELLYDYQALRDTLPESWFKVDERVTQDPDFVALAPSALVQIDDQGIWVEVKILRQYLSLMGQSVPNSRDVANLIGINTQRIAVMSVDHSPELLDLCIRCFNSYLRTTINARDPRTTYYLMNQYRLLAECLLEKQMNERVMEIMNHFQFYGQLGYEMGTTFLLEAAAHDIAEMLEQAVNRDSPLVDDLLSLLLELDQEIKSETQEESLLSVRRVQIQVATFFMQLGDEERARRIATDLKDERLERLTRVQDALNAEERPLYWEFTDRSVNFGYLAPERRQHLGTLFGWLSEQN
ncbi:MAG: DUF2254 domain-containing protein [Gammaproteobacteria bacterium]|nr:DUF2254 domain-containing protein [Gammaproteobacteria bacterium]